MKMLVKIAIKNWAITITTLFFIVTLIFFVVAGDSLYLQVHDNLDCEIVNLKMLKDNSLFWTFGMQVPFLGGIDRNYLPSDLKVYSWLYMIFPTLAAIIIGWYMKIAMSIVGFYLLGKTIYGSEKDRNLLIACGLIYGICPTFPAGALGFASLPLLMTLMIDIYRKFEWKYMAALFMYPLLSDFSRFGFFICGFIIVFFILDWGVEKNPRWRLLIAGIILALGYVVTEWRLFYIMLFSNQESIRTAFDIDPIDSLEAFKQFLEVFIEGHYHSASSHTLIVLPVCLLYLIWLNYRYIREKSIKGIISDPFNWLMLWQTGNCVIYAFSKMAWFNKLVEAIIPPLKGFGFARALWLSPFLWYFSFMVILCRVSCKTITKLLLCGLAFIVVCLTPNTYNHIYLNCKSVGGRIIKGTLFGKAQSSSLLSYREFYSSELFETIKKDIRYNGEWSIAYGMHPAVINYNGIATLDGYLSYYSKEYKDQFRKLIAPDLEVDPHNKKYFDTWGGRAYIFSKDTTYEPYRTSEITEADLLIDPVVFRNMGGKYVFSRAKVTNSDELGLDEVGVYTDEKSPYLIYVYRIR